jgi:hypothetical protein
MQLCRFAFTAFSIGREEVRPYKLKEYGAVELWSYRNRTAAGERKHQE